MINLEDKYLDEVKRILNKYVPACEVRVFGSRVSDNAQKYSDMDLVLVAKEQIDCRKIEEMKNAFSESNLPIMIDIIDWHTITESFRDVIKKRFEVIQKPDLSQK